MSEPYTEYLRARYRELLPTAGQCMKSTGTLMNFRPPSGVIEMAWLDAVITEPVRGACILEISGQRMAVVPWPDN